KMPFCPFSAEHLDLLGHLAEAPLDFLEQQEGHPLGKDLTSLAPVAFPRMRWYPITKVVDLESGIVHVDFIFFAQLPQLFWLLAEPFGNEVIDRHVLIIQWLFAVEASPVVGSPKGVSLNV